MYYAHFDSDQAIFGIMADDIVALRAFPLFMYGQRYLLAISVWLCAPLFAVFGASIVTLKLPMFLMNVLVTVLLWRGFRAEPGSSAFGSALATLPFAIPNVIVSTRLVEHAGGNIEPFVFVLVAWFLRERAVLLGVVLGIGALNREFALIAFLALLVIDTLTRSLRSRLRSRLISTLSIGLVVAAVRIVAIYFTPYSGFTAAVGRPKLANLAGFLTTQLPILLGAAPHRLADFNIVSALKAGTPVVEFAFVLWISLVVVILARDYRTAVSRSASFSFYLVLVGAGQSMAFILMTPSPRDIMLIRYILLSLLAICGLIGLAWTYGSLRVPTVLFVAVLTGCSLLGNVRLFAEYWRDPPQRALNLLADALVKRDVHFAHADYWTAYDVSWSTHERVIASPPQGQNDRIPRYRDALEQHPAEVYSLVSTPRPGCERILRWYLCGPGTSTR